MKYWHDEFEHRGISLLHLNVDLVVVIHQLSQLRTMTTHSYTQKTHYVLNGISEIRRCQTNERKTHQVWWNECDESKHDEWNYLKREMAWTILCNLLCSFFFSKYEEKWTATEEDWWEWENWERIIVKIVASTKIEGWKERGMKMQTTFTITNFFRK